MLSKKNKSGVVNFATFLPSCDANTFGIISPKSNSRKVITTVLKINPSIGASSKFNILFVITVSMSMIATFTKLFPIKIAASSFCGCLSNFRTSLSCFLSLCSNSSKVCGLNEKKATSDAEIKPEIVNNPIVINNEKASLSENEMNLIFNNGFKVINKKSTNNMWLINEKKLLHKNRYFLRL